MIFSVPFIIFDNPEVDNVIISLLGFAFAITINAEAQNYVAILLGGDVKKNKRAFSFNPLTHLDIFSLICFVLLGFGWARKIEIDHKKIKRKFYPTIIYLSGAVSNFLLANIAASVLYVLGNISAELSNDKALNIVLIVNLSFFVYNLILPVPPLCLGKALTGLIFWDNYQKIERKIYIAGVVSLAVLFCLDHFFFGKIISENIGDLITKSYFFIKS